MYTLSKNSTNNSGDAPSPYFTPIFERNWTILPSVSFPKVPVDPMYMFLISYTRSCGRSSSFVSTSHNFPLCTLSYAFFRSMNTIPIWLFVLLLYCTSYCSIIACSMVVWCFLNPAYVGAWSLCWFACSVSLLFRTDIYNFVKGGVMAMLL